MATLWAFKEHTPNAAVSDTDLAHALLAFHRAFASYPDPLPHFSDNLTRAEAALVDASRTRGLPHSDRRFLLDVAAGLKMNLAGFDLASHHLHGDPHLDGNVLLSPEGPLFVDFEAACVGPYEWDLTSLGRARSADPELQKDLLAVLSQMRSLCVATWCWIQYGRAPEVTEAAHVHLRFLRDAASG